MTLSGFARPCPGMALVGVSWAGVLGLGSWAGLFGWALGLGFSAVITLADLMAMLTAIPYGYFMGKSYPGRARLNWPTDKMGHHKLS